VDFSTFAVFALSAAQLFSESSLIMRSGDLKMHFGYRAANHGFPVSRFDPVTVIVWNNGLELRIAMNRCNSSTTRAALESMPAR
jgi:hypothetical protein